MTARLFGLRGAERLWSTIWEVQAFDIDPSAGGVWAVEEWSVRPPIDTVPEAVLILDWITDWMGEEAEYCEAPFGGAHLRDWPDAVAVVEMLRWMVAKKITEFQADELVATHEVEVVDGQLFVDGQPLHKEEK